MCFNGAAALTLRKLTAEEKSEAHQACFNGAAALTLRKRNNPGFARKTLQRFNGAAALTLRKLPSRCWWSPPTQASMGPQR